MGAFILPSVSSPLGHLSREAEFGRERGLVYSSPGGSGLVAHVSAFYASWMRKANEGARFSRMSMGIKELMTCLGQDTESVPPKRDLL